MNKSKVIAVAIVSTLLVVAMLGLRHTDKLNDQIELKQIELKDNSAKLKLLDKKYLELNEQLESKDTDKQKLEQDLQKLQQERMELEKALQAKQEQKAKDLAVKAQRAVTGTAVASAATGSCAEWMAAAGIPQTTATTKLILKESSCNPTARNPKSGAFGIPQAYPASKIAHCGTEPVCQLRWMDAYIKGRYGTWENALSTWYSRCGSPQGCWY